jgi:hypothetical protein
LPKGAFGGRRYLAHVHAEDTLINILIIKKKFNEKSKMRRTAAKVAGRKTIVKYAICFIY